MIVRQWRAWADYAAADLYEQHFREHVLPHLNAIDGFVGAQLLRRDNYGVIEFVALTTFESIDAIRAFAGERYSFAVVAPEAKEMLSRYDERCVHFELPVESWKR
jgi:heme-degrading monooxygenase HmoA